MRKAAILLVVFLLLLLAPLAVRTLQFYRPFGAARAAVPVYTGEGIPAVPTPATSEFNDEPVVHRGDEDGTDGIVVLDQAHDNQFDLAEIAHFDSLLAARGYQLAPFTEGNLADTLRAADALVVITPVADYSPAEALAVREFVAGGGRLLLVGDPTRYNVEFDEADIFAPPIIRSAQVPLNDLANAFDITFRGDYLYNTVENEGNFRNILLDEAGFAPSELTDGLERLAFYSAHSLELGPSAAALLSADENTWSSATDRPGGLTLAALSPAGDEAAVLALGDFHFLIEPYNAVYDNGAFAARVADFLTANGDGPADLAAFPYFLRAPVDLVYSEAPELGPDAFDDIIALQASLRGVGLPLALAAEPAAGHDTLILGLYNQAGDVVEALERAGIELTIRPAIPRPTSDESDAAQDNSPAAAEESGTRVIESGLGTVQMSGSALILLDETDERRQVIVLAASNDGLERALARLQPAAPAVGADFSDCLLQGNLAICPTGIENEPVEYELITSGPGETPAEPAAEGEEEPTRPPDGTTPPAEATDQGSIALGETKNGELAAEEAHAWTFSDGPATIDIVVDSDDDMDAVLELYDPHNELLGNVDSTFAGGVEEMRGIDIPDDGDYTIRVRDFFNDGGHYELTITAGEPGGDDQSGASGNRVFIFADDDGEPVGEGLTSAEAFADGLSGYDVTVWTSSADGPLPANGLNDYDLVIWDSGTYRDEDGLAGDDTGRLLDYLNAGGDLLINGASPTLLGPIELAPLENMAFVADDPVLSEGFEDGELIPLDGTYQVAITDGSDTAANEVVFLARAPGEEGEGAIVGLAAAAPSPGDPRTIILFAPFAALPAEAGGRLLANIMAWLGMS